MKITDIQSIPLLGETPPGGWAHELQPEDNLHTLIQVHTDEGLVGWGSCYTSKALVDGALQLLRPMFLGECAIEPERLSEKMHQFTFWQGRGGVPTHTPSAESISRSGTFLDRLRGNRSPGCLAGTIATGSNRTAPCSSMSLPHSR